MANNTVSINHVPAYWEAYDSRGNFMAHIRDAGAHFELDVCDEYAEGIARDFDGFTLGTLKSVQQLLEGIEKMAERYGTLEVTNAD